MKKLGRIMVSILPMPLFLIIQIGVASVFSVACSFIVMAQLGMEGIEITDPATMTDRIMEMYNGSMGLLLFVFEILAILIFGLWYGIVYVRKSKKINPMRIVSGKSIGALLVASVGLFFISQGFLMTIHYLFPAWLESYNAYMESAGITSGVLAMFTAIILAPIAEELVYRGIMVKLLKWSGVKTVTMIVIQALCFGIMHLVPLQMCYTFVVGLVLGYLAVKYDSVYISIAGHILYNFSGIIISGLLGMTAVPEWMYIILGVLSVGLIVVMYFIVESDNKAEFSRVSLSEAETI